MSEQKKQTRVWLVVLISVVITIIAIILAIPAVNQMWANRYGYGTEQVQTEPHHEHPPSERVPISQGPHSAKESQVGNLQKGREIGTSVSSVEQSQPLVESTDEFAETNTKLTTGPKRSLNDVIRTRKYWNPAYTSWYGKVAPEFTLTDITGKQHKLSDYRGKDVMLTFWATWCGPCIMEVPHLIALRNTVSKDKLAMFAISYITIMPRETPEMVRNFVKQNRINYTVFSSDQRTMPPPFNAINYIPCSFFINPEGRIKLATSGTLSLGEIKAILQAE